MFRKTKRRANAGLRRKDSSDDDDENEAAQDEDTTGLLSEARKRLKGSKVKTTSAETTEQQSASVMQTYESTRSRITNADLATSTAQHLPEKEQQDETVGVGADGIFRNTQRNKFLAGPIKVAQNVRVTARFDYEPSICKDYKETGFCGFGDTCIYLHDRGDTMTGWQLEQQWEEQQKKKKEQQEKEIQGFVDGMSESKSRTKEEFAISDGLPFACFLCREFFKNPVVTVCNHYFCESCIMNHVKEESDACPICSHDTSSVFNHPAKLIAKKKKILGAERSNNPDSWKEYAKTMAKEDDAH
ncbi:RING finger protein 113A [Fistulifera solaris]|uniref:RING finger protein 113A n=1 Tax=Fistulifera solaris TaxID=1519565 RepID=A0A1Z5JJG0_FISSO|nr:RING finger protein 113A [Fistulifera solaris]|eukprot:GAX13911.1 RING finger protein 113A [Fistulifera solaris]